MIKLLIVFIILIVAFLIYVSITQISEGVDKFKREREEERLEKILRKHEEIVAKNRERKWGRSSS